MIGYLRGCWLGDGIVDVNGVGYSVHAPSAGTPGEAVELHVLTVVRDDAITLYGFESRLEREVFVALTKVPGVGPASAMALLSSLGVSGVAGAIAGKDEAVLASVKGIGRKSAASLVSLCVLPDGALTASDPRADEVAAALVALGYDRFAAQSAAAQAVSDLPQGSDEDLIGAALVAATRGVA